MLNPALRIEYIEYGVQLYLQLLVRHYYDII